MNTNAIRTRLDGRVLFATFNAPPLNLIGPEIVRDLVTIVEAAEMTDDFGVIVFDSAIPDFFLAHVDIVRLKELRIELARIMDKPSFSTFLRRMSLLPQVTIAAIAGRARGAGSEFSLACDMRFAARDHAILGQMEVGIGMIPGGGAVQHLVRLMGRGRALEALISGDDFSADQAESYGWVNRTMPLDELQGYVDGLARRIAKFPRQAIVDLKQRVNEQSLPDETAFDIDSTLFIEGVGRPETQARLKALLEKGLQRPGEIEQNFGRALEDI
ncbi:enoyl-CoA hydratase/isomerase family protein [Acerihabitans sp.]|uniref:enoyl-CoA hydratase/isomerase family protein n=1 Tax=Acerihabitans sp. TaxID=2811394 RepID=UPI002EDB527B